MLHVDTHARRTVLFSVARRFLAALWAATSWSVPTPPPPKEYQFKPGHSGNPSGKPKGSKGFAARLRERTNDGEKLIEVLMGIIDGTERKVDARTKMQALQMIADRMYGKAVETVLSGELDEAATSALADMHRDDLEALARGVFALKKASGTK